jgi:hypothetical protein
MIVGGGRGGSFAAALLITPCIASMNTSGSTGFLMYFSAPSFMARTSFLSPVYGTFIDITERNLAEKELNRRITELEDFYDMAVGRELKMIELKKEIEELRAGLAKCGERGEEEQ